MGKNEEKLAVLQLLKQQAAPISLKDLLGKMGPAFKERSIRRWLAAMVEEGLVERIGHRRATKYKALGERLGCFKKTSLSAIAYVRKPLYERPPVAYDEEWFDAYIPNHTFYLPETTRAELFREGKRSKIEDPAGTYAHQIFNRLLIDLSYNSSRLEGNTYSLADTKRLILEGQGAVGKLDEETVMILNHKEAIRYLVDQAPFLGLNQKTFCTLHYLLADGLVEPQHAGKIRDHGVRIGGSTYIPYENPTILQRQLVRIEEKALLIEDPYEQSFFLLVHLSYLQPFTDVNKRCARLCANISLVQHNLVPLSFNDVEREDYTSAIIAIYELHNVQPLADLYVFSYLRTCAMYDATIKALGFDEVRVRYRAQRRTLLREIILRKLHGQAIEKFLSTQKPVPKEDRKSFLEDVYEDLELMDESRIAGLGITPFEFREWKVGF